MRGLKKKSSLYTFLESSGVLEHGTDAEIQKVRKEYWREYKRTWRKGQRKKVKEFTPSFSREEVKLLTEAARNHKMSRTGYIKRATLSYTDKMYIVPDALEVRRISQLLAMNYNLMKQMKDEEKISPVSANTIMEKISSLEHEVLIHLYNPNDLEEWIAKELTKNPEKKEKILKLILLHNVPNDTQESHS